jgi:SSS family solute:Na+ symporter
MDRLIVLSIIVAYFAITTLIGVAMSRRSRTGDDWAIAGRRMGLGLMIVGITATRVGAASTYGVAGDVIASGIWNLWYAASAVAAMTVLAWFYAKPYRRLQLQTVGEIFRRRFESRRCQTIASLCVQSEFLIINIIEPFIIAQILATVTGLSFGAAMIWAAAGLISYPAVGGLWASATTNAIHCIAILGGLAAVTVAGHVHLGGWDSIVSRVDTTLAGAGMDPAAWWHPAGEGWMAVVGLLLATVLHTPAVSIWVNFASAARDERSVVPAFVIGGAVAGLGSLLAGLIGIQTLAKYGATAQVSNYDALTRLAIEIDPWIGGIALAAVLAAVVSSGGPVLLASATMFVRDWVPGSERWSQTRRLTAYRATTIVYGVAAALIAWLAPIRSILDLVLFGFAIVIPPAAAVTYALYWKRTTEAGAFWGMVLGYIAVLAWLGLATSPRLTRIDPSYVATLVPLVAIPLISLMTPPDPRAESFHESLR